MNKTTPLIYVMLTVISILSLTNSTEAVAGGGFGTIESGESVTATYQAPVCSADGEKCLEGDLWELTIIWQEGVQTGVYYSKIVDNGKGSSKEEAEAIILATTNARACMRDVRYCPKPKKP